MQGRMMRGEAEIGSNNVVGVCSETCLQRVESRRAGAEEQAAPSLSGLSRRLWCSGASTKSGRAIRKSREEGCARDDPGGVPRRRALCSLVPQRHSGPVVRLLEGGGAVERRNGAVGAV